MESNGVHFKVLNPNTSNNIPQMKSNGFQAPFMSGQTAYTLGLSTKSELLPTIDGEYSTFRKIVDAHKKVI